MQLYQLMNYNLKNTVKIRERENTLYIPNSSEIVALSNCKEEI